MAEEGAKAAEAVKHQAKRTVTVVEWVKKGNQ